MRERNELLIKELLEKLFMAQGRLLDDERKLFFTSEIAKNYYPFEAINSGFESLYTENIKDIKIGIIINAIKEKRQAMPEQNRVFKCEYCIGSGAVVLEDEQGYTAAFACTCGNSAKNPALFPWNGEKKLNYHGKMYQYPWKLMNKGTNI